MAQASVAPGKDPSDMRRGACPTLGRPMATGDGLLARLRTEDNRLTPMQFRAVARAAKRYGNGILEVTARGSLQIRGLVPETVAPLEQAVFDAGVTPLSGLMVEVSPLAGIDPEEKIDPRPIALEIRERVDSRRPPLILAPKLAVVVDGGGRFPLGDVPADVRLTAIDQGHMLLSTGGTHRSAGRIAVVERSRVASAVFRVLEAIAAVGPAARGKDIVPAMLGDLHDASAETVVVGAGAAIALGAQSLGQDEGWILGFALPYRQAQADDIISLLDQIEMLGISDIRLAPGHGVVVTGLQAAQAQEADTIARRLGFWTSSREPLSTISLCAGMSGCASAHCDTRTLAGQIAGHAAVLLDGSIRLHLSGCPKGCAHPAPSALALVGAPSGYGLVVNGAASAMPAHYIAAKDLGIALERLASLVTGAKETGETARDCLGRLGPARIAAALKLDGR